MTCRSCFYWEHIDRGYGKCTGVGGVNMDIAEIILISETNEHFVDAYLETNEEHSCSLFKEKLGG